MMETTRRKCVNILFVGLRKVDFCTSIQSVQRITCNSSGLFFVLFICSSLILSDASGSHIANRFEIPVSTNQSLMRLVRHADRKIYIGAVNHLYTLNDNLHQIAPTVVTGPQLDHVNCFPDVECDHTRVMTDSVTKNLIIDYDNNNLIVCSNTRLGTCQLRPLHNISHVSVERPLIVASDVFSQAVMYIAPSVSNGPGRSQALYVGATRGTVSEEVILNLVEHLSSRSLQTLELTVKQATYGTYLKMNGRSTTKVTFKTGFSSGGFSYFTLVRPSNSGDRQKTYLARICQNTTNFNTYAEIPLECSHGSQRYSELQAAYVTHAASELARALGMPDIAPYNHHSDILFAVFNGTDGSGTSSSVLCMYEMHSLRRAFTRIIQSCFAGNGNTGPSYFDTRPCQDTEFHLSDDYCGEHDMNNPVSGTDPVSHTAAVHYPGVVVTSLLVTHTGGYTVAVTGTDQGSLHQAVIETSNSGHVYDSHVIDEGRPIREDMALDQHNTHVYAMSDRQVVKVRVQQCSRYTTCSSCRAARDPYCGWCTLQNTCTTANECTSGSGLWLPYTGTGCPTIISVLPDVVPIKQHQQTSRLTIEVLYLPLLTHGTLQCSFHGYQYTRVTGAQRLSTSTSTTPGVQSVQCDTPSPNVLPPIPSGQDHIMMELSLRLVRTEGTQNLASRNFTFFDCSIHTSCTTCTSSDYPCTWCVNSHRCTHDAETCGSEALITGRNVSGATDSPGPDYCPRIENDYDQILVPNGTLHSINVEGVHLLDFQSNFRCYFNINEGVQVDASISSTNSRLLECGAVQFTYHVPIDFLFVPFIIFWGERNALDNPEPIQVKVYECSQIASTCGECLTADHRFGCGWCSAESRCTIARRCTNQQWLDRDSSCPNPAIHSFTPLMGHTKGGTRLTIEGQNLGKSVDDVRDHVTVAGNDCVVESAGYSSRRIICTTTESRNNAPHSGRVKVRVNGDRSKEARSANKFHYVQPRIEAIMPESGPISGGTAVTIYGEHLNVDPDLVITISDTCHITSNSEQVIECTTNAVTIPDTYAVALSSITNPTTNVVYRYVEDPVIDDVQPMKGIVSGGLVNTVIGSRLDVVQEPQIIVMFGGQEYHGTCEQPAEGGSTMMCYSPDLSHTLIAQLLPTQHYDHTARDQLSDRERRTTHTQQQHLDYLSLSFGFHMDRVQSLRNLTARNEDNVFNIYPDPVFFPFDQGVRNFDAKMEQLIMDCVNPSTVLSRSDVRVLIGESGVCNVSWISPNKLSCVPPAFNEPGVGTDPTVVVIVNQNLTFHIGILHFEGESELLTTHLIIIVIASSVFVIIISVFFVCCCYKLKARKSSQEIRDIREKIDRIEVTTAKACKEAFADLQCEVMTLTDDVLGIPYRDYNSFCMNVLFPHDSGNLYPIYSGENHLSSRTHTGNGMRQFNHLLHNKTFILKFVHTLEAQPDFNLKDRVTVASLLSIVLQSRMDYHTDILKYLLWEMIDRSMMNKKHPKLLFRRNESIAEKMLCNWFTFLLHGFLKDTVGDSLFLLFRAIKQHVEKGPIDALTSEAKHSLAESKLFRQEIDYESLSIYVQDPDCQSATKEHVVRVLNCDTISQVKEKILDTIYKNTPYNSRPEKDDMDLEYTQSRQSRYILQDVDHTTKYDGHYRRLNTLKHYNVTNGASFSIIPKQWIGGNTLGSLGSNKSGSTHRLATDSTMSGSPSLSRSLSPNDANLDIENGNTGLYHLSKPHECETANNLVSEIYLTRLLATKGTLQEFVDNLFMKIFTIPQKEGTFPLAIKYMFDFLDDKAKEFPCDDPEVVHTWKSNSLPLRFWVNIVKNPNFVFDIHKSNIVDHCLSVIAQTFMDSCSMSEQQLSKNSPSAKLLYAKEIPKYKKLVEKYYEEIKNLPTISDQEMNVMLSNISNDHENEFNRDATLLDLYQYLERYFVKILHALEEDEFAKEQGLSAKLIGVRSCMASDA